MIKSTISFQLQRQIECAGAAAVGAGRRVKNGSIKTRGAQAHPADVLQWAVDCNYMECTYDNCKCTQS